MATVLNFHVLSLLVNLIDESQKRVVVSGHDIAEV